MPGPHAVDSSAHVRLERRVVRARLLAASVRERAFISREGGRAQVVKSRSLHAPLSRRSRGLILATLPQHHDHTAAVKRGAGERSSRRAVVPRPIFARVNSPVYSHRREIREPANAGTNFISA